MAVRQYIGARYVPLYVGDWNNTRNYEPLSIVTDANGNSFTSLKDVPAGTSLNDRDYWIQTSSFSGAVDVLQRRVNTAEDEIDTLQRDVTAAQENINTLQGNVTLLQGNVTTLQRDVSNLQEEIANIGNRKFLFIFDSYGTTYGNTPGVDLTIESVINSVYGNVAKSLSVSGGGFVRNTGAGTFLTYLQSAVTGGTINPADYTDVIVAAGRNDWNATREEISAAVASFYLYVSTTFPDAKKWFGYIANGQNDVEHGTQVQQFTCKKNLIDAALRNGVDILQGVDNTLHYYPYMADDFIHPNESGKTALAYALMQALTGGCDPFTIPAVVPTITAESGYTITNVTGSWVCYADNGITTVVAPGLIRLDLDTPFTGSVGSLEFAKISGNTLLRNPYASISIPASIIITDKNGSLSVVAGKILINADGLLSIYPIYTPDAIRPVAGVSSIVIMATSVSFPSSVG